MSAFKSARARDVVPVKRAATKKAAAPDKSQIKSYHDLEKLLTSKECSFLSCESDYLGDFFSKLKLVGGDAYMTDVTPEEFDHIANTSTATAMEAVFVLGQKYNKGTLFFPYYDGYFVTSLPSAEAFWKNAYALYLKDTKFREAIEMSME